MMSDLIPIERRAKRTVTCVRISLISAVSEGIERKRTDCLCAWRGPDSKVKNTDRTKSFWGLIKKSRLFCRARAAAINETRSRMFRLRENAIFQSTTNQNLIPTISFEEDEKNKWFYETVVVEMLRHLHEKAYKKQYNLKEPIPDVILRTSYIPVCRHGSTVFFLVRTSLESSNGGKIPTFFLAHKFAIWIYLEL